MSRSDALAWRDRLTPATRMGLSIAVATGLYGISFGALSVAAGLSVAQTAALSLLMFTGGSQFAFIGVVAGGGTGAAALGAASLLGVRNAVYGLQMGRLLAPRGVWRWLAAHWTIDESTATASSQSDASEQRRGFWVAGGGVFLLWNVFTLVGALLGDTLGDPRRFGLDGAAVAAFLGLLWPRLRAREPVALALVCGLATAVSIPCLPAGLPILLAAAVGAAWGAWHSRSAR
ncbi:MAG: AzlC family ABC transporter permease [Mesorhizobium sp.]|nr:AzlC family ABC transporter permease [Mesorhizobium sp.]MBN9244691.1 AzlC family ABC transporter permease [Mesorhizobium sp.]